MSDNLFDFCFRRFGINRESNQSAQRSTAVVSIDSLSPSAAAIVRAGGLRNRFEGRPIRLPRCGLDNGCPSYVKSALHGAGS